MIDAAATEAGQVRILRFPDGSSLELRPVGVRDGRLLASLAHQLSTESAFRRFLLPGRSLHGQWVARLIAADQVDALVEGAVATNRFGSSLEAVAESIRYPDRPDTAEVALVAAAPWQNMGVGTLLARHLAARAFDTGVRLWEATMLVENGAMASVLDSVGPKVDERVEQGLVTAVHRLHEPGSRP
jgi:GNAT superfamily N-acetyltransferase